MASCEFKYSAARYPYEMKRSFATVRPTEVNETENEIIEFTHA